MLASGRFVPSPMVPLCGVVWWYLLEYLCMRTSRLSKCTYNNHIECLMIMMMMMLLLLMVMMMDDEKK
ncbi:hypothetical protein DFH27DRAFT_546397 [Peziza echinospora]|nr:hypothetical protein DFH27DRAFT_546397 [Peziza echinospora]